MTQLPPYGDIERESFRQIAALVDFSAFSQDEAELGARVIHSTGDPTLLPTLRFSPDAIVRAKSMILEQAPLITDVRMVSSGISRYPSHPAIARQTPSPRLHTRSYDTMTQAINEHGDRAIYVIGCAPTALEAILDHESALAQSVIIGTPVGFVGAQESKSKLAHSSLSYITNLGIRGGSPVACALFNALHRMSFGEYRLIGTARSGVQQGD